MTRYAVDGLVRVDRVFEGTDLVVGQVLTIVSFLADAKYGPCAILAPGRWAVPLSHLSPVGEHADVFPRPAAPLDAEEADAWSDLVDLDPVLRSLTTAYGGRSVEDLAEALGVIVEYDDDEESYETEPKDILTLGTADGDVVLRVQYTEVACDDHDVDEGFLITDRDGNTIGFHAEAVPALMRFLHHRYARMQARRKERGAGEEK